MPANAASHSDLETCCTVDVWMSACGRLLGMSRKGLLKFEQVTKQLLLWFSVCVCITHVYTYVWYMCVWGVHMCETWRLTMGVFIDHFLILTFEQGLLLNPEPGSH